MHQEINRTTLRNGIELISEQVPHVRTVSCGAWFNTGSRDEDRDKAGISHLFEHMLFKGTPKRNAFEIARELEATGGSINAFTSRENVCIYSKTVDENLPTASGIISDIIFNSEFPDTELSKEKKVVCEEIRSAEDNPEDYIHDLAGMALWGDTGLGSPVAGTLESVNGLNRDDLFKFKNLFLESPTVISAAGNISHSELEKNFSSAFSALPVRSSPRDNVLPSPRCEIINSEKEISQSHLCIVFPGISYGSPERPAASLLDCLLGESMSSRLFQKIREENGLAYSIFSFTEAYRETGIFGINFACAPENTLKVISLINEQLRDLIDNRISDEEFDFVRSYAKGITLLSAENMTNRMGLIAKGVLYNGHHRTIDDIIDELYSVRPEDIRSLSEKFFSSKASAAFLHPQNDCLNADEIREAIHETK
ncbi:MAG: M16 family metallopeptidase [Fibrobacterota bacterium]